MSDDSRRRLKLTALAAVFTASLLLSAVNSPAEESGLNSSARILRSDAATFEEALARETKPFGTAELFARFGKWRDEN